MDLVLKIPQEGWYVIKQQKKERNKQTNLGVLVIVVENSSEIADYYRLP